MKHKIVIEQTDDRERVIGRCRVCSCEITAYPWEPRESARLCQRCLYGMPFQRWPEWTRTHELPAGIAYHPLGGQALVEARGALMHFCREIKQHASR